MLKKIILACMIVMNIMIHGSFSKLSKIALVAGSGCAAYIGLDNALYEHDMRYKVYDHFLEDTLKAPAIHNYVKDLVDKQDHVSKVHSYIQKYRIEEVATAIHECMGHAMFQELPPMAIVTGVIKNYKSIFDRFQKEYPFFGEIPITQKSHGCIISSSKSLFSWFENRFLFVNAIEEAEQRCEIDRQIAYEENLRENTKIFNDYIKPYLGIKFLKALCFSVDEYNEIKDCAAGATIEHIYITPFCKSFEKRTSNVLYILQCAGSDNDELKKILYKRPFWKKLFFPITPEQTAEDIIARLVKKKDQFETMLPELLEKKILTIKDYAHLYGF